MVTILKQARQYREIQQQDIADKLGVSRQTYWKMEKDPSIVTIKQAKEIGYILDMDPKNIFFADEITFKLN